jgi:hypothetical protein
MMLRSVVSRPLSSRRTAKSALGYNANPTARFAVLSVGARKLGFSIAFVATRRECGHVGFLPDPGGR